MPDLGVITGLASEADCFQVYQINERPLLRTSGASPKRAKEAANALALNGCSGLVSLGLSGGLDPNCNAGDILVPDFVYDKAGQVFESHKRWNSNIRNALSGLMPISSSPILGSNSPILTVDDKREVFEATGAVAVDMESHSIAKIADKYNIPFLAIRVIADNQNLNIPSWIMNSIKEDGQIYTGQLFFQFILRPWLFRTLWKLAVSNKKGLESLRHLIMGVGPSLQFPS